MFKKFQPKRVACESIETWSDVHNLLLEIPTDFRRISIALGEIYDYMAYDRWQNKHSEVDVIDTLSGLYSELYKGLQDVAPIISNLKNLAERTQREFSYRNAKNSPTVRDWIESEVRLAFDYLWFDDKSEEQQIINQYIDEAVDGWTGTDDPMDSENDYLRNKIVDYLEIEAKKIDDMLADREA